MQNSLRAVDILEMTPEDLNELGIETFALMQSSLAQEADEIKKANLAIQGHLEARFDDQISAAYTAKGSTFGKVAIKQDNFTVEVSTLKNISWDQEKLKSISDVLASVWSEDPIEYIDAKLSVSEAAYNGWPSSIKSLFNDARTVKPGTVKITVKGA